MAFGRHSWNESCMRKDDCFWEKELDYFAYLKQKKNTFSKAVLDMLASEHSLNRPSCFCSAWLSVRLDPA